jgi:plasmid rolling circle replication initiator protein Rep
MENTCVDCGKPCQGVRCAKDNAQYLKRRHLEDTLETDVMVLEAVAKGATSGDLERMLGISRTRAADKVNIAKDRMAKRKELGLPVAI